MPHGACTATDSRQRRNRSGRLHEGMTTDSRGRSAWQEFGEGMSFTPIGTAMALGHAPDSAECLGRFILPIGAGDFLKLPEHRNRLSLALPPCPPLPDLGFAPDKAGHGSELPDGPVLACVRKQSLSSHQANVGRNLAGMQRMMVRHMQPRFIPDGPAVLPGPTAEVHIFVIKEKAWIKPAKLLQAFTADEQAAAGQPGDPQALSS